MHSTKKRKPGRYIKIYHQSQSSSILTCSGVCSRHAPALVYLFAGSLTRAFTSSWAAAIWSAMALGREGAWGLGGGAGIWRWVCAA